MTMGIVMWLLLGLALSAWNGFWGRATMRAAALRADSMVLP